jgi:hypothetical protein
MELTKYRRCLLVMVCIITLILIEVFFVMHHIYYSNFNRFVYIKPNINALIEEWMMSDML